MVDRFPLILIAILIGCIVAFYRNKHNYEGFSEVNDTIDDNIIYKIRDTPYRKVYVMNINGEKLVWKYNRELSSNNLHSFCKRHPYINYRGITKIVGIMNVDGFDGVLMPYISNGNIINHPFNKKTILKLIDLVSRLDMLDLYAIPSISNVLIDDNGDPYIINYYSDTILKKKSRDNMKLSLIKTILTAKYRIDEDDVFNHLDLMRVSRRVHSFINGNAHIHYNHIIDWVNDL